MWCCIRSVNILAIFKQKLLLLDMMSMMSSCYEVSERIKILFENKGYICTYIQINEKKNIYIYIIRYLFKNKEQ